MNHVKIADRVIGPGHPPYIIAEMSGNHNGEIARAIALIDAAADAGADAVKMQTYTADSMTIDSTAPGFVIEGGLWAGRSLYDLYQEAATPYEWHPALFEHARKRGIALFSSPFDRAAVKMLDELGAPAFKIASFELNDLPLIRYAASFGKPLIMSTGLATLAEIEEAVETARQGGADGVILLHCVSAYPSDPRESNLRTIPHLSQAFQAPAGLSDHTHGTAVPTAAVALGASVIEKHLCLARADGGVDSAFSLEPEELRQLVVAARTAFDCLGEVTYGPTPGEGKGRDYRRSLYAVQDIAAGAAFTAENVRSIRPGLGLPPKHLDTVIGASASRDIKRGEPLAWPMVRLSEQR
ncbi:pseudaminic acid synthase [Herbaspirillum sp. C9C3]|uniref:pseudaminic acid synthase n=1 Tax=Herbaspirillum sp. C9C3 TaxID=2735271 RepID=UPI0015859021|nr:pseudaminic acid synthase [Herbaspirillum sp. C9C3]NUT61927.1 pseudaminic acid synthase [Herbaspirillum sp. C9C3]